MHGGAELATNAGLTTDAELRDLLRRVRSIAVLGIKAGEQDDAFRVPRYMQAHGYRIVPINPKLATVLGERALPSLAALEDGVDLVNVFRAPQHVPAHVDEILALSPRPLAVWLQLGISHAESAARLAAAGIAVVQDRCLMVDHRRLLGGAA
jgi:predicted CoA-binding protein